MNPPAAAQRMLYRNVALGGVERFGRDPAVGSSVFLTFMTDSMGFFIFLGLATLFLL